MCDEQGERRIEAGIEQQAQRRGEEGRCRPRPPAEGPEVREERVAHGDEAGQGGGVEAKTVAEFREALRKNLIKPTGMVLLTRDRIEEALQKSGKLVREGRARTSPAISSSAGARRRTTSSRISRA